MRNYKRLTAGILALSMLLGMGSLPAENHFFSILSASAEETVTEGTYEDLTYLNYGDHIEITKCYQWASIVEVPFDIDGIPVTRIADGAFKNCKTMTTLYLSPHITEIGDEAFYGCTQLHYITMPPNLERIGDRAFAECRNTDAFVFHDNLTEIGEEAFAGNWTSTVILPASLKTISEGAFRGCDRLTTLCIPSTVERIETDAFAGCTALKNVLYKGSEAEWNALSIASGNEMLDTAGVQCRYNEILVDREHTYIEGMDNWNFTNADLEYYYLSEESYAKMTAGMRLQEIAFIDSLIETFDEGYGGACAGLALISILTSNGVLDPADYQDGAQSLHDLALDDDLRDLITYYFLLQTTDALELGNIRDEDTLAELMEDGTPTYLTFFGDLMASEGDTNIYGHAVVAYGIEYGSWVYDETEYSGRLLIYDNNASGFTDENCLYFTEDWEEMTIPYYSPTELYIGCLLSDIDAINLHGLHSGVDYVQPERSTAFLSTLSLPESYTIGKEDESGSFAAMTEEECSLTTDGYQIKFALTDTQSSYALSYDEAQEMDLSMSYENCLLLTDANSAQQTVFAPSGSISISGTDMDYSLQMIFDEGFYSTDWYAFELSGSGTDSISAVPMENGYLLSGESLDGAEILTAGNTSNASLTITTDAQEVMVYAVDAGTLRACVDTDGDSTFETVIAESCGAMGDADSDSIVDATDSSLILIAAAQAGAGAECCLFVSQQNAADVNGDGAFDATDAALVLEYAAYTGSGGAMTIEEYLHVGA